MKTKAAVVHEPGKPVKLDEIITGTYRLDEVNEGYDDLLNGRNVRGIIVHEH